MSADTHVIVPSCVVCGQPVNAHHSACYAENTERLAASEAEVAALKAEKAEQVTVQELEWEHHPQVEGQARALCSLGTYRVTHIGDYTLWRLIINEHQGDGNKAPSVYDAKAAAQADFERRVLSCLTSPPRVDHEDEIRRLRARNARLKDENHELQYQPWRMSADTHVIVPPDAEGLVAELRARKSGSRLCDDYTPPADVKLMHRAANTIVSLTAEVAALKAEVERRDGL